MNSFREGIKRLYRERGLTQATLSDAMGIRQATLSRMMRQANPKETTVRRMAVALGVDEAQIRALVPSKEDREPVVTHEQFQALADRAGLSNYELARELGVTPESVRNWASGRREVSRQTAMAMVWMIESKVTLEKKIKKILQGT